MSDQASKAIKQIRALFENSPKQLPTVWEVYKIVNSVDDDASPWIPIYEFLKAPGDGHYWMVRRNGAVVFQEIFGYGFFDHWEETLRDYVTHVTPINKPQAPEA